MPEKCPQCGASLPAGALAGLCPACLLQQGAAADTATRPQVQPFVPPSVEEVARLFPQLEILGFLGKGGMGAVYKARQPALDRFVALKILPAQAAPDPGFAERFTREARALARLSHPNIVAVFEFGQVSASGGNCAPALVAPGAGIEGKAGGTPPQAGGTQAPATPAALPYFIMEFVDGVNLRQLQKTGRLSPREALQIVPQICDALQYAHDEGVVHRDIKPENVLVDRKGRVKIADFGLAKILGRDPEALRLTGEGQVMGTPHYMAPEQVEHPLAVDHRADIFSLGVVFYEMLTGELPLGKFQPPSRKVQVDVRLDDVVLHALEKEPDRRYQHVSEVKTDVQKITSAAPAVATPQRPPLSEPLRSGGRARKIVAAAIAAVVALTCVIAFLALLPALSKSPLPPGLVSWWPAEGDGSDVMGHNPGTLRNGASFAPGKVGQAFNLNGTSQYVSVPDSASLNPTECITVEAWIYPRYPNYSVAAPIIKKAGGGGPSGQDDGYALELSGPDQVRFYVYVDDNESWNNSDSAPLTPDTWSHVAGVYDGACVSLYLNGELVGPPLAAPGRIVPSHLPLQIGHDASNPERYFHGLIDEASVYNTALTAEQIRAIYRAGNNGKRKPGQGLSALFRSVFSKPPPASGAWMTPRSVDSAALSLVPPSGLVAWWPLDGNAADVAGGHNGAVEGSCHFGPAEVGQGLYLEGERSGISVPDSPDLNFGPDRDFSLEAWIQPLHSDTTTDVMIIVDKRAAPDLVRSHGYTLAVMNGKLSFQISDSLDAPMLDWEQNGPDLRDGVWHHVAATVERASAEGVKLYVDGEVVATFDPTPARGDLGTEQPLLIGMHQSYPWYRGNYRGGLDEVSLYKRALRPAEIHAIFAAGKNGKRKPGHTTRVEILEKHP
jgi:serine/threonine protein kinase